MTKRATLKDIAIAANVSAATVSYILNNTPGKTISDETRRRVLAAAERLQYVPNTSAQRLKTNRAKCIAVRLNHNLVMARYHNMLQGIRSYLNSQGYSLLLASHDGRGSLAGCIDACISGQADGLIYIAAQHVGIRPKELAQIRERGIPVSAIDCMGNVPDVSSVVYDYYASSRARMEYLLERGFRKFLYLRPLFQNYKETAREQGVRSVMLERSDVSVEVRTLDCLDENWQANIRYSMLPTDYGLVRNIRDIMDGLPGDVAVVCYAREAQEMVSRILFTQSMLHPTPESARWYLRTISYHFPHFDAGVEAAARC